MKKVLSSATFLVLSLFSIVQAQTPVQEQGASTGTLLSVSVTTTPTLIVSTGTLMTAWGFGDVVLVNQSTATPNPGQMLWNRLAVEICNDCGHDIHVGFNSSVSTQAGANYGRRLPANNPDPYCLSMEMKSPEIYAVSGTTATPTKVTVMQIK